jgi:hypothetical protein
MPRGGGRELSSAENPADRINRPLLTDLLDVRVLSGDPVASADPSYIVLSREAADDQGVVVGDTIDVEFAAVGVQTLTVGATYENEFLVRPLRRRSVGLGCQLRLPERQCDLGARGRGC